VSIVDQYSHAADIETHHPPGIVLESRAEPREYRGDRGGRDPELERDQRCAGDIRHVVGCNTVDRQWHVGDQPQVMIDFTVMQAESAIAHAAGRGTA